METTNKAITNADITAAIMVNDAAYYLACRFVEVFYPDESATEAVVDLDNNGNPCISISSYRSSYGTCFDEGHTLPASYLMISEEEWIALERVRQDEMKADAKQKEAERAAERELHREVSDRATYEKLKDRFDKT